MKVVKVTVRTQNEEVVERAQARAAAQCLPFSPLVINLLAEYLERQKNGSKPENGRENS